jgi:hypothetical protein
MNGHCSRVHELIIYVTRPGDTVHVYTITYETNYMSILLTLMNWPGTRGTISGRLIFNTFVKRSIWWYLSESIKVGD